MTCSIAAFVHCRRCIEEINNGEVDADSPKEYARLSVGFSEEGLQVWCNRHDINIVHIDFEGQVHPAALDDKGLFFDPELLN